MGKMKKAEKKWEEVVEQLNGEVEVLERENGRLKSLGGGAGGAGGGVGGGAGAGGTEKSASGAPGPQSADQENHNTVESNLDQAQLIDQVRSLNDLFFSFD